MFSWICPRCGREVPPSYTECPDCAAKGLVPPSPAATPAQPPANVPPGPEVPPQPAFVPQPPLMATQPYGQPPQAYPGQYAPQQYAPQYAPPQGQYPQYQAPPQYPPPQYQPPPPQYAPPASAKRPFGGAPTWLLTVGFAVVFVGLVAGVYWLVGNSRGNSQAASPPSTVEHPSAAAGGKTSPLQKYVEISGVRFTADPKRKIMVKFIVTNHSDADLSGLSGNVTIWGRTQKSEEDAVGTFAFNTSVPPESSQEVTAPLTTKLKIYELPDWQNVNTDLQITAPQ
ncbi:MAG: hypothetical protein JO336_10280 [Acidobacteriia bacterium]|nr:hypothetical protein [Terriglobia bacterium]MBV8903642.1 hypothetical protein [Terriglobia bacterium]